VAADALTRLGSSCEPPPSGVSTQDLFKPSIRLEEDVLAPVSGITPCEDSPAQAPGTPSGKDGVALAFEADLGTSSRPIG
jgi:hypothetical protein